MQSKRLSIILATVLGLSMIGFVGCGGGGDDPAPITYESKVPQTGQTTSIKDGDDAYYAARGVGVIRNFSVNGDVITDNATGLKWDNKSTQVSVYQDLATAESFCPSGWRLPTLFELISITDKSVDDPSIFSAFTNIGGGADPDRPYWSSDEYPDGSGDQWIVNYNGGGDKTKTPSASAYVRCVQGTTYTPSAGRFDTSVDDVVIDTWTNLMWQDNEVLIAADWEDAIDQCEALTLNDKEDWRLPNFNELYSIADRLSGSNPAIDSVFDFTQNTGNTRYWSSTIGEDGVSGRAWTVDFVDGRDWRVLRTYTNYPVRCVRTR